MFDDECEWEHQWLSNQIWSQTCHELNWGGLSNNTWPQWAAQMINSVRLPGHINIPAVRATQMVALLSNDNCRELQCLDSVQSEEAKEMREQIERFSLCFSPLETNADWETPVYRSRWLN